MSLTVVKLARVVGAMAICVPLLLGSGCGGGDSSDTTLNPDGTITGKGLHACTYTPYAGGKKSCSNVFAANQCQQYNYGTVGDEQYYTYSQCSDLGF